jgi:hypothetical protein
MAEKWRELTTIEDYEFDPDGKYDGALYNENWEEIFDQLYQRAETTEEYLYNDWIDPVSTRNAMARRMEKNGHKYIVLKYYDGMYVLYEIADSVDLANEGSRTSQVIAKLDEGVSIRAAILEAVQTPRRVFEDVAGMDQEQYDQFITQLDNWTGGSGKKGWVYDTSKSNNGNTFTVVLKKNPVAKFDGNVILDVNDGVLNGELYYKPTDVFFAASGPVSFAGLKSVIRDLVSQVEMADTDFESSSDEDIYGY